MTTSTVSIAKPAKAVKAAVTAYVMPLTHKKFVCIANNKPVGKSANVEYFEYHNRQHDTKLMQGINIDKFVYLTAAGKIDHVNLTGKAVKTVVKDRILVTDKAVIKQLKPEARFVANMIKHMRFKPAH